MERPKIRLRLVDRLGPRGCHHGHAIGDTFDFDTERGKLCPMAAHAAFPYVDILRYGGPCPSPPRETSASAAPTRMWPMCSGWRWSRRMAALDKGRPAPHNREKTAEVCTLRQCMDAENLHRRLKKIVGQVQAIDRMVDEDVPCEDILSQINAAKSALHRVARWYWRDTSSTVSGTGSSTETRIRPSPASPRRWSGSPT